MADASSTPTPVVLLIHGTFARQGEPGSPNWFQPGSPFWNELNRLVAPHARCNSSDELFLWNADNSEMGRREGSRLLRERIRQLEKDHTPYHLVGHSHGGSVIWRALRTCLLNGDSLDYLAGWTTVGTPFLTFKYQS